MEDISHVEKRTYYHGGCEADDADDTEVNVQYAITSLDLFTPLALCDSRLYVHRGCLLYVLFR